MSTQYAFRAQRTSGLIDAPAWEPSAQVSPETAESKSFAYSPDGAYFAQALNGSVQLVPSSSSSSSSAKSIPVTSAIALTFSPQSRTLFTYERPIKSDGTDVHKNVRAWDVQTGEEVASWHHKAQDDWIPSIDLTETYRLLPTSSDLLVYSPPLAPRPSLRLKADAPIKGVFLSKPGALPEGTSSAKPAAAHSEPAVAVWLGEKKGAPGSVRLYPISQLVGKLASAPKEGEEGKTENRDLPVAVARKAFYKADKLTVKWNNAGTMALFLAQTDSDTTGKSYYGETNLYSLSLDGSFDGMVDLDKEGPIYDFVWSPTSREFVVCYGYMPARTQLFDIKNKPQHSFGSDPRNFLLYQPQGKLLLSAGFGNLAGGVDVWDMSTRNKVAEFKAANSSYCEWSPCGRYIMTATLSPRLRVDNGVKIWWCGGQLLHIHPQEMLYQASFKPNLISQTPSFPAVVPKAPEANASVAQFRPKGEETNGATAKPAGAYRPPGARGTLASDAYKRDENDGTPNASGAATPVGTYKPGQARGGRGVPGAPPGAPAPKAEAQEKKKRVRSKRPLKEEEAAAASGNATPAEVETGVAQLSVEDKGAVDEVVAKKVRALNKKLKAIDELKERLNKGEVLEKTQLQKIENAASIKAEIAALGGDA